MDTDNFRYAIPSNNTHKAHNNMDTYDDILEEDLKPSVAATAYVIYELAVRDHKVPSKPAPAR